jgi:hypothetical protein
MPGSQVLAATLVEPGKYELREYPFPDPEPGCVVVKMELSGICGTDKHTYSMRAAVAASRFAFPSSRDMKTSARSRRLAGTASIWILKASR